jgi:hypothetical protein
MTLEKVLGVGAVKRWPYLVAKLFHMGVDVDGLACHLHHPMACNRQTGGHGFLLGAVLSRHCSGQWYLFGVCEGPGLGYSMECSPSENLRSYLNVLDIQCCRFPRT